MEKVHQTLRYVTPDTVAECWDGVLAVPGLYQALWDCVQHYNKFDVEDCGPHDVVGLNSVAQFWSLLSDDHKTALNRLSTNLEGNATCQ